MPRGLRCTYAAYELWQTKTINKLRNKNRLAELKARQIISIRIYDSPGQVYVKYTLPGSTFFVEVRSVFIGEYCCILIPQMIK